MKRFFFKQLAMVLAITMLIPLIGIAENPLLNEAASLSTDADIVAATEVDEQPGEVSDIDLPDEENVFGEELGDDDNPNDVLRGEDTIPAELDEGLQDEDAIPAESNENSSCQTDDPTDLDSMQSDDTESITEPVSDPSGEMENRDDASDADDEDDTAEGEDEIDEDSSSNESEPSDDSISTHDFQSDGDDGEDAPSDEEDGIIVEVVDEEEEEVEYNIIDLYPFSSELDNYGISDIMESAEHSLTESTLASYTILEAGDTIVAPVNPLVKNSGFIPNRYITWNGGSSSWSHLAIDYKANEGQNIMSIANGFVKETGYNNSSG